MDVAMSVADAAYNTVHDYPHGGAAALGQRLGKANLSAEVNPRIPTAKFSLEDAVKVQILTGDPRILYAMAAALGYFPPVPMPSTEGEATVPLKTLSELAKEFADVVSAVAGDLADAEVSDNDLAHARREWQELIVKGQLLMQQLTAMNARNRSHGGSA